MWFSSTRKFVIGPCCRTIWMTSWGPEGVSGTLVITTTLFHPVGGASSRGPAVTSASFYRMDQGHHVGVISRNPHASICTISVLHTITVTSCTHFLWLETHHTNGTQQYVRTGIQTHLCVLWWLLQQIVQGHLHNGKNGKNMKQRLDRNVFFSST